MITLIQQETDEAVLSMEAQNADVEGGLHFTEEADLANKQIQGSIDQVTDRVQEVSTSIVELRKLKRPNRGSD
jgi:methyl-accepting chemotaxis protein